MQLPHRIILMTGSGIFFEDSGAPFIITTKEIAEERRELFAKLPCTVLLIEELLENENTENPQVKIGEHDLCYCIYTSGSTGKPKGVLIEHINLANFVNPDPKNAELMVMSAGDRFLFPWQP